MNEIYRKSGCTIEAVRVCQVKTLWNIITLMNGLSMSLNTF